MQTSPPSIAARVLASIRPDTPTRGAEVVTRDGRSLPLVSARLRAEAQGGIARIAECRDKLPGKPREALDARLASAGGQDDDELATALRMKLNTFLQNVTRARQLIAECLGKRGVAIDLELGA